MVREPPVHTFMGDERIVVQRGGMAGEHAVRPYVCCVRCMDNRCGANASWCNGAAWRANTRFAPTFVVCDAAIAGDGWIVANR